MKSTLLLAFAFTLALTGNAQIKQTRTLPDFTGVDIGGAFTVHLRMGEKSGLTIVADEKIIDKVETEVTSGILSVDMDEDWWDSNKSSKVELYITLATVRYLQFSGACEVSSKNTLRGGTINLKGSGATEIKLALSCSMLAADFSGASNIKLSGTCPKVNLEASGATEFYAADLQTETMNIDVSGASEAIVFATKQLNIDASGASEVRYKGNPAVTQDVSGASSVQKL